METSIGNVFYDVRPDETKEGNMFTRIFEEKCQPEDLIWHRDKKDRTIKVISGVNEVPEIMKIGDKIKIKKETYHRIHKGQGRLIIEIEEHD